MEEEVIEYLKANKERIKQMIQEKEFEKVAFELLNSKFIVEEDEKQAMGKAYFSLGQILSYNYSLNYDEKDFIELVGLKKDLKKAISCYEQGTKEGNVLCVNKLYNIYFYRQEGVQNLEKALHYAKLGAQMGDVVCCFKAGVMYHKGQGTEIDEQKAERYLTISSSVDASLGAYELAQIKENYHTKVGEMEAFELYKKAATAGDKLATLKLGKIYMGKEKHRYRFVEKDPITAQKYLELYLKKERNKTDYANKYLGILRYENGDEKEKISGLKKIVKIAKKGDEEATKYLETKTSYGSIVTPKVFDIPKMQESVMNTK